MFGHSSGISSLEFTPAVRICKVAEKFLIFESEAAILVRRSHNISGTLVGTTPQQPTQNIFLGLPVEIRSQEAYALVQLGAAFIVDIAAAHRTVLSSLSADFVSRKAHTERLRRQKLGAELALAERKARIADEVSDRLRRPRPPPSQVISTVKRSMIGSLTQVYSFKPLISKIAHNSQVSPWSPAATWFPPSLLARLAQLATLEGFYVVSCRMAASTRPRVFDSEPNTVYTQAIRCAFMHILWLKNSTGMRR